MMMGGKGVSGAFTYGVNGTVTGDASTGKASYTLTFTPDDDLVDYDDVFIGLLYSETTHASATYPSFTSHIVDNLNVGSNYVSIFYKKVLEGTSSFTISSMSGADGAVVCGVIVRNTDWSVLNPTQIDFSSGTTDANSPVSLPDSSPAKAASNGFSISCHVIDSSSQWTSGNYYGGWTDGTAGAEVDLTGIWLTASIGVLKSQTMGDTPSSYDTGSYGSVGTAWQKALSIGDW